LCPGLLSPGTYGILDEIPSPEVGRPLVLVSKMLQNVSNGVEFGAKEAYMLGANKFITEHLEQVRAFFDQLTTLPPGAENSPPIASISEVTSHDLRMLHTIAVKNLAKIVKSLVLYKQKDVIPKLYLILVDLGDPSLVV